MLLNNKLVYIPVHLLTGNGTKNLTNQYLRKLAIYRGRKKPNLRIPVIYRQYPPREYGLKECLIGLYFVEFVLVIPNDCLLSRDFFVHFLLQLLFLGYFIIGIADIALTLADLVLG